MDSIELRQMSIDNAKLALDQAKFNAKWNGFDIKTNRYTLTLEQREGIKKMMVFFCSEKSEGWMFKVNIGLFPNGRVQWIGMKGIDVFRHLEGVFNGGTYGNDGQEILNGIRKVYIEYKNKDYE